MKTYVQPGGAAEMVVQSAALWTTTQTRPSAFRSMTGRLPQQPDADSLLRGKTTTQSTNGMPIVQAMDITAGSGQRIYLDLIDPPQMIPRMGDEVAEGYGAGFSFTDDSFTIAQARFVANPGSQTTRHVIKWDTEKSGKNVTYSAVDRYRDQRLAIHLFSGRGEMYNKEWTIPLASDQKKFNKIMVNPVRSPARACHFVWNSAAESLDKVTDTGGEINIDSADVLSTDLFDALVQMRSSKYNFPRPINIPGDKMSGSRPTWLVMVPDIAMASLVTDNTTYRSLLTSLRDRASRSGDHDIFNFAQAYWNDFVIVPVPWNIFWKAGSDVSYCADATSSTESSLKVPAGFGTGNVLGRAVVVGAGALAEGYGLFKNVRAPIFYKEKEYDFDDKMEQMCAVFGGCVKVQHLIESGVNGEKVYFDDGMITIDIAIPLNSTIYNELA